MYLFCCHQGKTFYYLGDHFIHSYKVPEYNKQILFVSPKVENNFLTIDNHVDHLCQNNSGHFNILSVFLLGFVFVFYKRVPPKEEITKKLT